VLIFHRVLPEPDPLLPSEPDAAQFATLLALLRSGFNVLPLREAVERLRAGTLPARGICITFDDGYANNCEVAMPLLVQNGLPATVFVAPGFLGGGRMFNDSVVEAIRHAPPDLDLRELDLGILRLDSTAARVAAIDSILRALKYLEPSDRLRRAELVAAHAGAALPTDLMMTPSQVRRLHDSGIEIGAHTVDHPILARVDNEIARHQIVESKRLLEQMVGAPVSSFAYPNGRPQQDYQAQHVAMARDAGFTMAVSTAWGAATAATDPFQVPRVSPWGTSAIRYGGRLLAAYRDRRHAVA
jgi:peptidoglycan/xylan/chitin deacetylase (PgdA/CDA1 family)